jgi:hypothetical protein
MHIIHDEYLAIIRGVCKHFLVACHAGIEADLTTGGADGAESFSVAGCPVFKNEDGLFFWGHNCEKLGKNNAGSDCGVESFVRMPLQALH